MSDQEPLEQLAGMPRGAKGDKGDKGERGLPRMEARAVVFLFLLNFALIVAGYLFVAQEVDSVTAASHKAARAAASQLALCQSSNRSRAQQADLWEFLIHLSSPPKTEAGRKALDAFTHHMHVVLAPRNCAHLGQPP